MSYPASGPDGWETGSAASRRLDVVFVCRANRCRSPMAAALLRSATAGRAPALRVASMGLGPEGIPASAGAVTAMAGRGIDLSDHLSLRATARRLREADVIVAMTTAQVREIAVIEARVWPLTFTFHEIVRRGGQAGPRGADEALAHWVRRLSADRHPEDLFAAGPEEDIADPMGGPQAGYDATAVRLDGLARSLAELIRPISALPDRS